MELGNFETIFKKALGEWSETLNLAVIQHQDGGRYLVPGLGRQLEQIERGYIGSKEEIIWRELHWAIFTVIHSVAKSLSEIRVLSIRAEAVQCIFEQRLQTAMAAKDTAWDADDFALVQAYLDGSKGQVLRFAP